MRRVIEILIVAGMLIVLVLIVFTVFR